MARMAKAAFLAVILLVLACAKEPNTPPAPVPCCCEFLVQGDVLKEDFVAASDCTTRQRGRCIQVDPMRMTPHPCCPQAKGERCGG